MLRVLLSLIAASWALLFTLTGCDEGAEPVRAAPASAPCEPGDTHSCTGVGGCPGERVCSGSPPSYGSCHCATPPARSDAGRPAELGGRCQRDAQCPAAATCLTPNSSLFFG